MLFGYLLGNRRSSDGGRESRDVATIERLKSIAIFLVSIATGFAVWQIVAWLFFSSYVLPRPASVFVSAWETTVTGELPQMVWISLLRILAGFAIGCVVGIGLGLVMASSRVLGEFLDPLIELVRPISPVAIIPIAIVWLGVGEAAKAFVVAYGVFFITLINTMAGVRNSPLVRKRAAMCLGAKGWRLFFAVTLPSAVPYINTGMRVALGSAFASVVAAEMIAANEGIGYFIMQARLLVQVQRIFVGLLTLGLIGFFADRIYRYLSTVLLGRYLRGSH
jgi:NitT/TauT family transport system permease protein/taurine transport system permease protein